MTDTERNDAIRAALSAPVRCTCGHDHDEMVCPHGCGCEQPTPLYLDAQSDVRWGRAGQTEDRP